MSSTEPSDDAPEVEPDELREGLVSRLGDLLGDDLLDSRIVPGTDLTIRVSNAAWARAAPAGTFGVRQRWIATCRDLARDWPVLDSVARWRLGELSVAWECVVPRG